ncbi:MAG: chromosome segregation protein SMC [Bacteroidetes bacterium QS_9_68_14]|nr:MAG: chromosome segregation protein SMC [Bacteroidetes bacterium QS_9_68_14]
MYLSQLTLHGFKSFAEPTTLEFAPGITAIVGPNGCGKSNIVDAVRWAVGEQRPTALRSETMDDVIFNGTAERKPLGMADVELTVENNRGVLPTEYSEVALGRRLFRDGTSEYLLNQSECRLKDIRDLFMDTGMGADAYSVIELKMIDDLLSDSTEERRRLFEEAAGITRYKRRRRQALRKLENTQQDLDRVRDLTGEVEKNVRRLEKQAERAEEHRTISRDLHRQERALAEAEYTRLAERRDALASEVQALREQADALEADQSDAEDRLEALRETLAEREGELSDEREALKEARDRVRKQEGEQRLAQERLAQARRDAKRLRREAARDADRREDLQEKQERLEEEIAEAASAREEAEATLEEARSQREAAREEAEEEQQALRALRQREEELEQKRAEERSHRDRRASRLETLEDEQRRAYDRLETLDERADELAGRVAEAEATREEAESDAEDARAATRRAEADHAERKAALEEATEALEALRRKREAARAEVDLLESLVADYGGHGEAVQLFAEEGLTESQAPEDFRTVAGVLSAGEDHRAALAAALGGWAACPVAATRAEARQALTRLRARDAGRATVIALDRLPAASDGHAPGAPDGAEPLRPLVRPLEDRYAPLADALLENVFLTGSLEEAERLAGESGPHVRFVTPNGEWAGGTGLLHGGAREDGGAAGSGRIGRREQLAEHRRTLEALSEEIEAQEAEAREAEQLVEDVPLDRRREALRRAEERAVEAAEEARRLAHEQETLQEQQRETADRLDALEADLEEGREALETLREEAEATGAERQELRSKRKEAEAAAEEAEEKARAAQEHFGEARVAAVEARSRHESLQQEQEQAAERLAKLEERRTERKGEQAALQDTIEEAEEKQNALQDDIEDARADRVRRADALEEAREGFETVKTDASEAEETLRDLRQQREEVMHQESEKSVRLAEIKTRLEELVESTAEDFDDLHLPDNAEPPAEDFDEEATRREVGRLRKKLRRLGDVNPLALKEYDEEKERLDFLREQQADLEEAEDTLLDTVTEINEEAAARFEETFSEIRRSFSEIFERLFGSGAAARLQLADEEDGPLESDIEIIAQPPGKRPSILPQLSGGEKALTAIALLFAIYLVKPSPFCILDEVDAPLDDANTGRFMRLLRDFTDETQFILVTHNKRTMRQADRLYGVTMQEQGVSTLVGVELEEAAQLAEAA